MLFPALCWGPWGQVTMCPQQLAAPKRAPASSGELAAASRAGSSGTDTHGPTGCSVSAARAGRLLPAIQSPS